ncbi:MAG TPA: hypothetical protein DHM44_08680 [Flexistipes sinusarabici]|uniref:DUF456 domain-containing protein n=1 Tax=Flexistipes sinusarabici TaxID=2352 RepID=A0A3D5QDD0_FLESI|nr:hypothetical protein [Flexistipes sinusarabici]
MIPVIIFGVTALQFLFVMLNLFSLPGNMLAAIPPIILYFTDFMELWQLMLILAIVAAGEIFEWISGFFSAKKTGATNKSVFASIAGAIVVGVIMAPLFFGIGALIGSVIGAFAGTFIYEKLTTSDNRTAILRSTSIMKNRMFAIVIKFSLGISIVILTGIYIYQ